ncbi:MAG TPA: hypothetical protein VIH42_06065 [Thermoguttaceae bacterium]
MSEAFDPYHRWLGIPPKDQPPHHYRLLGIDLFEDDTEVIRDAAERQMAHVRNYQLGQHSAISQKILNELAAAKACLLARDKKAAYDAAIKEKLSAINSSAKAYESTPSPPTPPPLPNDYPIPMAAISEVPKTSDLIDKLGLSRYIQGRLPYIGLGVAIAAFILFVAIFVMPGDREDSSTSSAFQEIAQNTNPTEPQPSDQAENESASTSILATDRGAEFPLQAESQQKPDVSEYPKVREPQQQPETSILSSEETLLENDNQSIGQHDVPLSNHTAKTQPEDNQLVIIDHPPTPHGPQKHQPRVPVERITLSLPFGKIFNSRLFDVDLKSIEDKLTNELKQQLKEGDVNGKAFLLLSPSGATQALGVHDKGRLDGVYLSFYNDDSPLIFANYSDGKLHGVLKKWNENGQRVYWCQYAKGVRHGFCCYFKDDILRILFEINLNKINGVHLCSNSELEKSFDSFEQAAADNEANMLLDEVNAIESELKSLETAYKKQIKDEFQQFRKRMAAELGKIKRDENQIRMNQRNIERQNQIDILRRKGGM